MTELLLKLFIKDHQNIEDMVVRTNIGRLSGIVGILCNFLLFLAKLFAGIVSNSVSVIADALNNLSDASSSLVTFFGFHLAKRPADQDHPYGHARYEYLSALLVSWMILFIGAELLKSSVIKIINPETTRLTAVSLILLIASLFVKLWMCFFYKKVGKKISSGAVLTASLDSRNDVVTTLCVLAGLLAEKLLDVKIDGYIGLLVALFIIYAGVKITRETISPLLGWGGDEKLHKKISQMVLSHEKIIGIHDLLLHDYGPGKCFASLHAEMSADINSLLCHDIIDEIECRVLEELNVNLVIHYDPVVLNDRELLEMKKTVEEIVMGINPMFSLHDFRMVRGAKQDKLVFDLALPYEIDLKYSEIKEEIEKELSKRDKNYVTVIRYDRK